MMRRSVCTTSDAVMPNYGGKITKGSMGSMGIMGIMGLLPATPLLPATWAYYQPRRRCHISRPRPLVPCPFTDLYHTAPRPYYIRPGRRHLFS